RGLPLFTKLGALTINGVLLKGVKSLFPSEWLSHRVAPGGENPLGALIRGLPIAHPSGFPSTRRRPCTSCSLFSARSRERAQGISSSPNLALKWSRNYHTQVRASDELDYHCLVDECGRVFDARW